MSTNTNGTTRLLSKCGFGHFSPMSSINKTAFIKSKAYGRIPFLFDHMNLLAIPISPPIPPPPPEPPPIYIFMAISAAEVMAFCLLALGACDDKKEEVYVSEHHPIRGLKTTWIHSKQGNTCDYEWETHYIPLRALLIEELAGLCHCHANKLILAISTSLATLSSLT